MKETEGVKERQKEINKGKIKGWRKGKGREEERKERETRMKGNKKVN